MHLGAGVDRAATFLDDATGDAAEQKCLEGAGLSGTNDEGVVFCGLFHEGVNRVAGGDNRCTSMGFRHGRENGFELGVKFLTMRFLMRRENKKEVEGAVHVGRKECGTFNEPTVVAGVQVDASYNSHARTLHHEGLTANPRENSFICLRGSVYQTSTSYARLIIGGGCV